MEGIFYSIFITLLKLSITCQHTVLHLSFLKLFLCSLVVLFVCFTASESVTERSHETFNYMANSIILNFMKLFLGRIDFNIGY